MNFKYLLFYFVTILVCADCIETSKSLIYFPCSDNKNFFGYVEREPFLQKLYYIIPIINEKLEKGTTINLTYSREYSESPGKIVNSCSAIRYGAQIKKTVALLSFHPAYTDDLVKFIDFKINGLNKCKSPSTENILLGDNEIADEEVAKIVRRITELRKPFRQTSQCGLRNKKYYEELISHGTSAHKGDWPWHVALNEYDGPNSRYICGGTLISETMVLTAAHCVTRNGMLVASDTLTVIVGANSLPEGDEKQISYIIVHPNYNYTETRNDIALLKLSTRVTYNDNVVPACLSRPELSGDFSSDVQGTVLGWGLNEKNEDSDELQQAVMPKIPSRDCIESSDVLAKKLNENSFCAGYRNGTSACKGDSGGGFHVFLPDIPGDTSPKASGRWFVHGIVSLGVTEDDGKTCDAKNFGLFTNVNKFLDWISLNFVW